MNSVQVNHSAGTAGVVELVLDRPEAMNAISTNHARALTQACQEIAEDPTVTAVVMTSTSSRAFSVGADLKERAAMSNDDLLEQRPVTREAYASVWNIPVPVIAAVHGYALGGGCELALACDLIVADVTAEFGLPEVSVGLIPGGGGTQLLTRRVGITHAADLVLTGRRVDADEAARMGLVTRVVPRGKDRLEALALAEEIAGNSPHSVRLAKQAVRQGADLPIQDALDLEDELWRVSALSKDRAEGIAAWVEKRKPRWPSREGDAT